MFIFIFPKKVAKTPVFRRIRGFCLVPVTGLEPVRCRQRWILSPLRLPIPSHRQVRDATKDIILYCIPFFKQFLCKKLIFDAEHKQGKYDQRQDIADIKAHPVTNLKTAALVCLFLEVFPAPSIARGAEQQVHQRAQRQPNI